jgi:A/G-specific adenine glycosylase
VSGAGDLTNTQAAVLEWGDRTRRDLPWRRTRDPWAVLVSEFMLTQTQVARVIPKWEAFMTRWPDPVAGTAAPLGEVIAAWSGLGYNRRAVFLHRAAAVIAQQYGGSVPAELDALIALPGVGPYTARAVLAFAFEQTVGVVDTNAGRVLARAVAGRTLGGQEVQALADGMVPTAQAWAWNQAVLDLGATVCTARRPGCGRCPLGPGASQPARCAWARMGGPDPAVGSAGTSRPQSTFVGSDRQGRGRLLATLVAGQAGQVAADQVAGQAGPAAGRLGPDAIAAAAGWPHDGSRAAAVAQSLVDDGLAVKAPDGTLLLP